MKTVVENMVPLDANKLARGGVFNEDSPAITLNWTNGSSVGLLYAKNVLYVGCMLNGEEKIYEITVLTAPCQFGGKRYYFRCPQCSRRRYKLRMGRKGPLCRQCYKAPYYLQECGEYDALVHKYNKAIAKLEKPMRSVTRMRIEREAAHYRCLSINSWMGEVAAMYKDIGMESEARRLDKRRSESGAIGEI